MHLASFRRPSSKMDTAIHLLQHLAALAAYEGEACAQPLFQAADYLQDVLDSASGMEDEDGSDEGMAAFNALMDSLSVVLPDEGRTLHS